MENCKIDMLRRNFLRRFWQEFRPLPQLLGSLFQRRRAAQRRTQAIIFTPIIGLQRPSILCYEKRTPAWTISLPKNIMTGSRAFLRNGRRNCLLLRKERKPSKARWLQDS